jgi:hypothetical protein
LADAQPPLASLEGQGMKKRPSKFISVILVIAVILILTFLPGPLLDRLFLPWAFDRADHPALPGVWVGSLTTATGHQHGVFLEMYLPEPKGQSGLSRDWRSAPYGEVEGTLRMCDEHGQVRSYTIDGNPEDREASHLRSDGTVNVSLHRSIRSSSCSTGLGCGQQRPGL